MGETTNYELRTTNYELRTTNGPDQARTPDERKRSQTQCVLTYIAKNGSITAVDALREFGCFRLAARVKDLRERGNDIRTAWRRDGAKRYAIYYLPSPEALAFEKQQNEMYERAKRTTNYELQTTNPGEQVAA